MFTSSLRNLALGLGFILLLPTWAWAGEDDFITDAQGRSFRARFDPGSRISLGVGFGARGDEEVELPWQLSLAFDYRFIFDFGDRDHFVQWRLDHRFLGVEGDMDFADARFGPLPALDAVVYYGAFERHASDSYITFPSSPPSRVFFPFDVGLEAELGRVTIPRDSLDPEREELRLTVLRSSIWLDPWRSGAPGTSVAFGLGPRYDLDLWRDPGTGDMEVIHRVAPFSALMGRIRAQDDAGLTVFDFRADFIPHWASVGDWTWALDLETSVERILISINDTPLSLKLSASYQATPAPEEERAHRWQALGWLVWSLPLQ